MTCLFQEAHSARFGRHLVAAEGISAGQAVLEQQPYAAVLYGDQVPLRCDWCFRTAAVSCTLLRCTRSKFAHYCSREHQKAAWKAYYRQECAALVACAPHAPPATVRLAARVLWRRDSEHPSTHASDAQHPQQPQQHQQVSPAAGSLLQQQLAGGAFGDVQQLLSHWEDLDDARKLQYAQMAVLTREFMQGGPQQQQQDAAASAQQQSGVPDASAAAPEAAAAASSVDLRQIAQLLATFACNSHTICDEELRPIGVGLYPLGALINHGCRPNCVQTFAGRNIVFRPLSTVPAGQQLTISYIELAATRQERRRQLLEQYFFDIDARQAEQGALSHQKQQPCTGDGQQGQQQQQHGTQKQEQLQQQEQALQQCGVLAASASRNMRDLQQSGLQQLQLLVTLPDSAVQLHAPAQQQDLLLWTPSVSAAPTPQPHATQQPPVDSSNGGPKSHATSTNSSCSSGSGRRGAPWPADPPDAKLCQMLLLLEQNTGSRSTRSSHGKRQHVLLPGGMYLLPQLQAAVGSGQGGAAAASAAALSGLFQDLEGLGGVGHDESALIDAKGLQQQGSQHHHQQQQQQMEAVQWGDWSSVLQQQWQQQQQLSCTPEAQAAAVNGHSQQHFQQHQQSARALAAGGTGLLLHVWQLQQQAERLTRAGHAALAVQLCQAALAAADGIGPYAFVSQAPAARPLVPEEDSSAAAAAAAAAEGGGLVLADSGSDSGGGSSGSVRLALGPAHVLRIRGLAALLCAAVDAAQWQVALQAGRQLTPLYELVYPQVWPNLGLHYAMLAKLELLLEQPAAAARMAEAAASVLRVTHGSSAAVLQEVYRTRYEAAQELAAADSMAE